MSLFRRKTRDASKRAFETKSHAWAQVGLAGQLSAKAVRRARREVFITLPLLVGVLLAYNYREDLFGLDMPIRVLTVICLVALGWAFARAFGRALGPLLFRRMDPSTAGTVGFLIRLVFMGITVLVALRISGLEPRTLAVGGAFTAVIVGLAAQQTLGNLIAGTVLLSARPFRVGERVHLQGGGMEIEGVVSSLGLLYTTLATGGENTTMVPNSAVLAMAIQPLHEPDAVDLRARLRSDVRPTDVQDRLAETIEIETRSRPEISLEEFDGDEVVVRIAVTPVEPHEGAQLADEILEAIADMAAEGPNGTGRRKPRTTPSRDRPRDD